MTKNSAPSAAVLSIVHDADGFKLMENSTILGCYSTVEGAVAHLNLFTSPAAQKYVGPCVIDLRDPAIMEKFCNRHA